MAEHFQREIHKLKAKILTLGGLVEENFRKGTQSVIERDIGLAQLVIDEDEQIDDLEVEIEEECLKILALYQPVAIDLRYIVVVLKINNELERIGDLSSSVSKRTQLFQHEPGFELPNQLKHMSDATQQMLNKSLNALVHLDSALAREVLNDDDVVDRLNREIYDLVRVRLMEGDQHPSSLIHLLTVARAVERAADHVTNIAEDIIYMIEGEIVRHAAG